MPALVRFSSFLAQLGGSGPAVVDCPRDVEDIRLPRVPARLGTHQLAPRPVGRKRGGACIGHCVGHASGSSLSFVLL